MLVDNIILAIKLILPLLLIIFVIPAAIGALYASLFTKSRRRSIVLVAALPLPLLVMGLGVTAVGAVLYTQENGGGGPFLVGMAFILLGPAAMPPALLAGRLVAKAFRPDEEEY